MPAEKIVFNTPPGYWGMHDLEDWKLFLEQCYSMNSNDMFDEGVLKKILGRLIKLDFTTPPYADFFKLVMQAGPSDYVCAGVALENLYKANLLEEHYVSVAINSPEPQPFSRILVLLLTQQLPEKTVAYVKKILESYDGRNIQNLDFLTKCYINENINDVFFEKLIACAERNADPGFISNLSLALGRINNIPDEIKKEKLREKILEVKHPDDFVYYYRCCLLDCDFLKERRSFDSSIEVFDLLSRHPNPEVIYKIFCTLEEKEIEISLPFSPDFRKLLEQASTIDDVMKKDRDYSGFFSRKRDIAQDITSKLADLSIAKITQPGNK